ncbi:hypothetical protein [Pseudofrankia asymbiotica]|uniref:Guanylate cyclase domain-containing protein n=1 Tax=Pseudofrankia asymbiotica TaxID=1834516 RepID=A0A1V2IJW2_9ACTN|nr:hypothetical protein [Pseudofrankia asymbiotica]ONH33483.1 hypothetical protein BL253_01485 [Pseudofrankia asymbiotica]
MTVDFRNPLPATVLALDVKGYSERSAPTHLAIRQGLRDVVAEGFRRSNIDPLATASQDTGDGVLAIIPAEVPKAIVVADLIRELGVAVSIYNRTRNAAGRLRLRAALHHGDVIIDGTGYAGDAPIITTRLVNAPPTRAALEADGGQDLALILSDSLYQDTVAQGFRGLDTVDFVQVEIRTAKFQGTAWLRAQGSHRDDPTRVPTAQQSHQPNLAAPGSAAPAGTVSNLAISSVYGDIHAERVNFGITN